MCHSDDTQNTKYNTNTYTHLYNTQFNVVLKWQKFWIHSNIEIEKTSGGPLDESTFDSIKNGKPELFFC